MAENGPVGRVEDQQPRSNGSTRLSRNESEKMRRIRIKNYLMELASLVPSIVTAHKKLDKTSVLRLTVNFLRIHNELTVLAVKNGTSCLDFLRFEKMRSILMQILGGFLLIIDSDGTILYTSESIVKFLGISVVDVLGLPVGSLLHPDDEQRFHALLISPATTCQDESDRSYRTAYVRMVTQTKGQVNNYSLMQFIGHPKTLPTNGQHGDPGYNGQSSSQVIIGVVRPVPDDDPGMPRDPAADLPMNQYVSRHDLSGQILDADSRAAIVLGYCPVELHGLSAYELIHHADIPFALNAHFTVIQDNGYTIPRTFMRLKTKCDRYLFFSINTHVVINMLTKKPQYLLSVNIVMEADEGEHQLEQQRKHLEQLSLDKYSGVPELSNDFVDDVLDTAGKFTTSTKVHKLRDHSAITPVNDALRDQSNSDDVSLSSLDDASLSSLPMDTSCINEFDLVSIESQPDVFSTSSETILSPEIENGERYSLDMDIDETLLVDWVSPMRSAPSPTNSFDTFQVTPPRSEPSPASSRDAFQENSFDVIEFQKYMKQDIENTVCHPKNDCSLFPKEKDLFDNELNVPTLKNTIANNCDTSAIMPLILNEADEKSLRHPMLFYLLTCESDGNESS